MYIDKFRNHLNTRRQFWRMRDQYMIQTLSNHRFIAKVGDVLVGLSYAEISSDGAVAIIKMNLKSDFAEYGIGSELLALLMDDLVESGYETIRYTISREHYAFQIYQMLDFEIESEDIDEIRFVRYNKAKRKGCLVNKMIDMEELGYLLYMDEMEKLQKENDETCYEDKAEQYENDID